MINDQKLREVIEGEKLRLLKAIVQMTVTYYCESWPLMKREINKQSKTKVNKRVKGDRGNY